jgi:hypothetical protein
VAIYAVIRDGKVENTVVWDGANDWTPPDGTFVVRLCDEDTPSPGTAGIDWDYVDGEFVDNRVFPDPFGDA